LEWKRTRGRAHLFASLQRLEDLRVREEGRQRTGGGWGGREGGREGWPHARHGKRLTSFDAILNQRCWLRRCLAYVPVGADACRGCHGWPVVVWLRVWVWEVGREAGRGVR